MIHNIIADLMTATSKEMITALLFGVLFLLFGIFTEKNKLAKRVAILFGCIAIIVVVITFILQATPSFSIVAFSIVCIVIWKDTNLLGLISLAADRRNSH